MCHVCLVAVVLVTFHLQLEQATLADWDWEDWKGNSYPTRHRDAAVSRRENDVLHASCLVNQ